MVDPICRWIRMLLASEMMKMSEEQDQYLNKNLSYHIYIHILIGLRIGVIK